jgi:hypothetical protein
MPVMCEESEQNCAFLHRETSHHAVMKTKELTPKQILSVRCPTCGAATGEVCELNTGTPRTEPHRDRKLSAADAVEMKLSKRHPHAHRVGYPLFLKNRTAT